MNEREARVVAAIAMGIEEIERVSQSHIAKMVVKELHAAKSPGGWVRAERR